MKTLERIDREMDDGVPRGIYLMIITKGQLLADIVTSHDLGFLCLTEIHFCLFDTDIFLWFITPSDFIFLQRPRPSGIGACVVFLDPLQIT